MLIVKQRGLIALRRVTALKVTSAVLFFVAAHLIVPRVTSAAGNVDNAGSQSSAELDRATLGSSIGISVDGSNSKSNKSKLDANNSYEPPNYGGPESEYGSGTR